MKPTTTPDKQTQAFSHGMSVARMVMIYGLTIHHLFQMPSAGADPTQGLQGYTFLLAEALSALFHLSFICAVPLLSVISGYLFFNNSNLLYRKVLAKKALTIALPSFVWCGLWLIFGFCLYMLGKPYGWFEWANYDFENLGFLTFANGIFGLYLYEPFAYQFWFIHDLMFTILIYPIIYLALMRAPHAFVLVASVAWFMGLSPPGFFSFNVTFFFVLGGFLAIYPKPRLAQLFQERDVGISIVCFFMGCLILRAWTFWLFSAEMHDSWVVSAIHSDTYLLVLRALGVMASVQLLVWLYHYGKPVFDFIDRFSGYSFFIFAAHFPIIEFYKILAGRVPGQASNLGLMLTWLLVPLITVVTCIGIARFCSVFFPQVFHLLNGGRSLTVDYSVKHTGPPTKLTNQAGTKSGNYQGNFVV